MIVTAAFCFLQNCKHRLKEKYPQSKKPYSDRLKYKSKTKKRLLKQYAIQFCFLIYMHGELSKQQLQRTGQARLTYFRPIAEVQFGGNFLLHLQPAEILE